MAKPIGNGKSMEMNGKSNAALDRSWLLEFVNEEFSAVNQGSGERQVLIDEDGSPVYEDDLPVYSDGLALETAIFGSKSNDFFYIDPSLGFPGEGDETPIYGNLTIEGEGEDADTLLGPEEPLLPYIDGLGGADQIIMMEEAIIGDTFFTNMDNVTVLKLWDGNDVEDEYAFTGSQVTLAEKAQEAGIREATGGPGDDVIDFSGYVIENDDNGEPIPLDIIIRGGAGADEMTASDGNDTFIWKAGDMEGTDADNFDTIYDFNVEDDVLNIAGLLEGFGFDATVNDLDDWVKVEQIDNSDPVVDDTLISIDSDGIGPNGFEELVLLQGVESFNIDDIVV